MSKTRHSKNREERLNNKRRMFLTTLVTMGGVATAASFAPWTQFLWDSIVKGGELVRNKIRFADGRTANVDNVPINSASTFVYPRTGDPIADAEPLFLISPFSSESVLKAAISSKTTVITS